MTATTKTDDLIRQIEDAIGERDRAVEEETMRVEKSLRQLQESLARSGVLKRVAAVLEKADSIGPEAVWIPLYGHGDSFLIGVRLNGEFASRHDQRKTLHIKDAAKWLAQAHEYKLGHDQAELEGCVDRYLASFLETTRREAERMKSRTGRQASR